MNFQIQYFTKVITNTILWNGISLMGLLIIENFIVCLNVILDLEFELF